MSKHTPGPLLFAERLDGDYEVTDAGGAVMATVYGDVNDPQCWPVADNARLFAASPDLLDLVRDYEVMMDGIARGLSPKLVALADLKIRTRAALLKAGVR